MAIVDPKNRTVGIHALGNSEAKEFKEFDLIPVHTNGGPPCMRVALMVERFTCRCPITGQPDHAKVVIRYEPKDYYLETKSLKLYIESFRDTGIFHEHLASRIAQDIEDALKPKFLWVDTKFDSRGGISVDSLVAIPADAFPEDESEEPGE